MQSETHAPFGTPFPRNRFLKLLLVAYLLIWVVGAIEPVDRDTWLLENWLTFGTVLVLGLTHRAFVFSRLSYALIFVFMFLHVVGSHYTYSAVPVGAWVSDALDLGRNHYDRLVHFSFGLLLAYPARELTLRMMHVHRVWSYLVPVMLIVTLSSIYEMIESWAARVVNPDVGLAFLGAQGDVWDGQKDMTLAMTGAMIAMALTAAYRRVRHREPYVAHP